MAKKCTVLDERFVEPCKLLAEAAEYGNPRGKQKGVYAWDLHIGRERSRTFFGVKSGEYVERGIAFNFCPFCGEKIDAPTYARKIEHSPANANAKGE